MMTSSNKKWLIVIAVILVGIFTVMLLGVTQNNRSNDSIGDIIDSADDGAEEFREEVLDEIDDNTDSQ